MNFIKGLKFRLPEMNKANFLTPTLSYVDRHLRETENRRLEIVYHDN